jgi:uncharacterized protein
MSRIAADTPIPGCSIYHGVVRHKRTSPVRNNFSYRVFLFGLDLEQIESAMACSRLLGFEARAHSSYRRTDYFGDPAIPLDQAVRDHVQAETGTRPKGPIELVTQLRTFGYSFNPVSFYYCWPPDRSSLQAILVEITNTPWGERHAYVLPWQQPEVKARPAASARRSQRWEFRKNFHISPFSPMELDHDWRFAQPGQRLAVHMINRAVARDAEFEATLLMERRDFTRREVRRAILRHPCLPTKTLLGIYWQALRLWLKRAPFHAHPAKRTIEPSKPS